MITLSVGWLIAALLLALLAGLAVAWPWRARRASRSAPAGTAAPPPSPPPVMAPSAPVAAPTADPGDASPPQLAVSPASIGSPVPTGSPAARGPSAPLGPTPGGPATEPFAPSRRAPAPDAGVDPVEVAREQAAILRLMEELDPVAEGDLTARATVGPELAGAIAETVNFTLDELQGLVARVDDTAASVRVAGESAAAAATAARALAERRSDGIGDAAGAVAALARSLSAIARGSAASAGTARDAVDAASAAEHAAREGAGAADALRADLDEAARRVRLLGALTGRVVAIADAFAAIVSPGDGHAPHAPPAPGRARGPGLPEPAAGPPAHDERGLLGQVADAATRLRALADAVRSESGAAADALARAQQDAVDAARQAEADGRALASIAGAARAAAARIGEVAADAAAESAAADALVRDVGRLHDADREAAEAARVAASAVERVAASTAALAASIARFRIGR